jgi:LmbE family N-acetylglucosaminyl deacetylase
VRIPRHFTVDVGATFATKQAMLAKHQSQADWVAKQHGIVDHLADMVAWTRRVGRDAGVEYAEGFRQYRHPPYPKTPVLQDLLGAVVLPQEG